MKGPKDFPDSPMVKIPPFNAGGVGSIPGRGAIISHATNKQTKNRNSIVTDSIKALKKWSTSKKVFKKQKNKKT